MASRTNILYTQAQIKQRVTELAKQISNEYKGKNPIFIGILKGSFIFFADLIRELYKQGLTDVEVDFMTISSYGKSTTYSGASTVVSDITKDIKGRDVLVVEDIIDTGHTLVFVKKYLAEKKPKSLKMLTFLDKIEKREIKMDVDYVGFTLKGKPWVEGYGLDGGEYGRGRPDIAEKI
ncbi:MAG: hypoxanthine phosphoribosyltransferase [Candidatus Levybacteria bacterium]|nr:hypoxanthine phosphoribosyltransferase [Candidatus Levybacteria bacterium]